MKTIIKLFCSILVFVLFISCQKTELDPITHNTFSVAVRNEQYTKTVLESVMVDGGKKWKELWEVSDTIWPATKDVKFKKDCYSELVSGAGTQFGEFKAPPTDCMDHILLYPYNSELIPTSDHHTLSVTFPKELEYDRLKSTRILVCYGWGQVPTEHFIQYYTPYMIPATTIIHFWVKNIPDDVKAFDIAADKRIVGRYKMRFYSQDYFETTETANTKWYNCNYLRIWIPENETELEFFVSIPAGEFNYIKINPSDGGSFVPVYEEPTSNNTPIGNWYTIASFNEPKYLFAGTVYSASDVVL